MADKLTDNDIKKALECCIAADELEVAVNSMCATCPMDKECDEDCDALIKNALDLINRLEAENERLSLENEKLRGSVDYWMAQARQAESEAIKAFAERLCEGRVSNDPVVIAVKAELEMTEGKYE